MVPMYAARVEHLTHHETVTALCAVCGHVAEVRVADLWRKFPSFKRILEIRLWCTRCGERERIELDATKHWGMITPTLAKDCGAAREDRLRNTVARQAEPIRAT